MSELTKDQESYIEHEVQIRLLNFMHTDLYKKFDSLESKLESRFLLLAGLIISSVIIPVVLHSFKLV